MDNKYSVSFKDVSKIFKLKGKNKAKKKFEKKSFYALQDINFNVEKGDVIGILGTNGSGKSTLSRILAGISVQDSGKVEIRGEQALIAIKTGLNNQLTGLENIRLKGALLGLSRSRINEIIEEVAEFSELGDCPIVILAISHNLFSCHSSSKPLNLILGTFIISPPN